jgi:hypothetical protein
MGFPSYRGNGNYIKVIFDSTCNNLTNNEKKDIVEYFNFYNNGTISCEDMGRSLSICHHRKIGVYQQNLEEYKVYCP